MPRARTARGLRCWIAALLLGPASTTRCLSRFGFRPFALVAFELLARARAPVVRPALSNYQLTFEENQLPSASLELAACLDECRHNAQPCSRLPVLELGTLAALQSGGCNCTRL